MPAVAVESVVFDGAITSTAELTQVAAVVEQYLCEGLKVALCGGLGAGKTTFMRILIDRLGGDATEVSSPTFVLEHRYLTPKGCVSHWDLYRLSATPPELHEVDGTFVHFIEWADKFPPVLAECGLVVSFAMDPHNEGARGVRIVTR